MATILLVDDNDLFREAIQKLLTDNGHTVISAKNGKLADDLHRKHSSIDLVICDIKMPELDGRDLTRRIRTRSTVPVILITGFSEIAETLDAYEFGANAFLAKPFQSRDLFDTIKECLAENSNSEPEPHLYRRIRVENFAQGRQIQFPIFVCLREGKYVRIAHNGEDLSRDRIDFLKERGVPFLYLRAEDYRKYLGENIQTPKAPPLDSAARVKKLEVVKHCIEALETQVKVKGVDEEEYQAARAFLEAAFDIISDDRSAVELLDSLRSHTDFLLTHSLGVCLYSVMAAHKLDWNPPQEQYNVAFAGLFRPLRGLAALDAVPGVSSNHPVAKLIYVADAFCARVLNAHAPVTPGEALQEMKVKDGLEKKFVGALASLFKDDSVG